MGIKKILLLILLFPTICSATIIRLKYDGLSSYDVATVWVDGNGPRTAYFGLYHLTTDSNNDIYGFCIDPYQGVPTKYEEYENSFLVDGEKTEYINEIFDRYYDSEWEQTNSKQAVAFHLALLEILFENFQEDSDDYDVNSYYGGSGFRCESQYNNLANGMLHSLDGGTYDCNLKVLKNNKYQDYIHVPEPATIVIFGLGILFCFSKHLYYLIFKKKLKKNVVD